MLIRSRSIRFAAIALAAATPLVASYAAPAFAAGDDADVSASITTSNVHVTSTKGLSRVTVVLCNGDVVVADSWSGALEGDVTVGGAVRAVFIHSGNNTTADAQTLLDSLAAGAVKGDSTGAIAYDKPCTTENPGGQNTGGGDNGNGGGGNNNNGGGDNNNGGGDNGGNDTVVESTDVTDPGPTTAGPSDPAPSTTVLGVTIENASNPAPAPALAPAAPAVPSTNSAAPEVAGNTLPRTGGAHLQFLMTLALSLVAAGVTLRAAFGRRIRSASFPG